MDITVVGRNAEISSRLRDYVEEKAAKVEQLDPRVQRVEVEVTHERNPRQADTAERAEITVISRRPSSSPTPGTRRSRTRHRLRPSRASPSNRSWETPPSSFVRSFTRPYR